MRFFSNEAKDNAEERDPADSTVQSEPVAVPPQRAGSPWQHAPAEAADDPDRPPVHEPAPQPTAFGASTVGGAVAASAAAGPHDTASPATDRTTDAASGVADDRTVPLNSTPTADRTDDVDKTVPLGSTTAEKPGTADDEVAWTGSATHPETHKDKDDSPVDLALEDHGTFDDPKVADEVRTEAETPAESDKDREGAERAERADEAAAMAAPAGPAPFFPTADTQALRERWRDVQLRFVDDPKGATAEAAGLVDEAVDKLTSALRDQRGSLSKGTEDTEALRVELRSYRDILDRLLGL
ncbi:hypothetical protein AB0F81_01970 [Actinoplanes sp. NPDC024001]|uniref:hypothetical protein n=1 Tax=Actinoplanes sp. NPDC024001 TaxID=3154598 RepID=UPI0033FC3A86